MKTPPTDDKFFSTISTELGWIRAIATHAALIRLDWQQSRWPDEDHPNDVSRETITQLTAYFAGRLRRFELPTAPVNTTTAARHWLSVMATIPYAETVSYGEFAIMAGMPKAARAAGTACATNPLPIIYPCHRVLRANGSLGHYGGGSQLPPHHRDNIARKAFLIHHEQQMASLSA